MLKHAHHTADVAGAPRIRFADLLTLAKPELTLLSVFTAVGAAWLAVPEGGSYLVLFWVLAGTMMVGGGAGSLNQWMERSLDRQMKRTERRPLASGRMRHADALIFGSVLSVAGTGLLFAATTPSSGILAVLTLLSYLLVYTPLKRVSPFSTVIGGIPGALPPLIGWAAVDGTLPPEAWALFFILFFWQMPHFLSLSWMYRTDYARARYRMLCVEDESGIATSRQTLIYSAAFVPAALMPTMVGLAGMLYFAGALIVSGAFLFLAIRFFTNRSVLNARKTFLASLVVLPALFALMLAERLIA